MLGRPRWGLKVCVLVGVLSFSFEASSQTTLPPLDPNGALVGGFSPEQALQSTPTTIALGRTAIIASDPFAGIDFDRCEQAAAQAEFQRRFQQNIEDIAKGRFDFKRKASEAVGGMFGTMLGGGSARQGLAAGGQFSFGTEGCQNVRVTTPLKDANSCPKKADDSFDEARLLRDIQEVGGAADLASCQLQAAETAKELASCFDTEFTKLKDQLKKVKEDLDDANEKFADYVKKTEADIEEGERNAGTLEAQAEIYNNQAAELDGFIKQIGAGVGDSSAPNTGTVAGLQAALNNHVANKDRIDLLERRVKANATSQCLRSGGAPESPISQRTCPAGGQLQNPKDCIFRLMSESISSKRAGGGNRKNADKAAGNEAASLAEQDLLQMIQGFDGTTPRFSTFKEFKNKKERLLKQRYGQFADLILAELEACADEGVRVIDELKKDPADPLIGGEIKALNDEGDRIAGSAGEMFNEINTVMRNAARDLFNEELINRFDPRGCHRTVTKQGATGGNLAAQDLGLKSGGQPLRFSPAPIQKQIDCLQSLKTSLEAMRDGTSPTGNPNDPPITIQLPAPNTKGQKIACSGLRDCGKKAADIAGEHRERVEKMRGKGTFAGTPAQCPPAGQCLGLARFHQEANKAMRDAIKNASSLLAARMFKAKAQMDRLSKLLGNAKIEFPDKDAESIDVNKICPDSEVALCETPQDMDAVMLGLGGLPNLNKTDFRAMRDDAENRANDAAEQAQQFKENADALQANLETCRKQQKQKAFDKKIAKIERGLDAQLRRCQSASGLKFFSTAKFQDFANFSDLNNSLLLVCDENAPSPDKCSELSNQIADAETDCGRIITDASISKAQGLHTSKCKSECMASPNAEFQGCMARCEARFDPNDPAHLVK